MNYYMYTAYGLREDGSMTGEVWQGYGERGTRSQTRTREFFNECYNIARKNDNVTITGSFGYDSIFMIKKLGNGEIKTYNPAHN